MSKRARQQLPTSFENKAGRYELIRTDGDRALYTFTNRHGNTTDAIMPVATWYRMHRHAGQA